MQLIPSFLVHTVSADRTRREQRTATRHRLCDWSSYIASLTAAGSKVFIIGLFELFYIIIIVMSMRTTALKASLHVYNRFRFFFPTHLVTKNQSLKNANFGLSFYPLPDSQFYDVYSGCEEQQPR